MKKIFYIATGIIFIAVLALLACGGPDTPPPPPVNPDAPRSLTYSIGPVYPHDTSSFTEGLLIYKNEMYESTGLEGKSKLMQIDIKSGKAKKSIELDPKFFGFPRFYINLH